MDLLRRHIRVVVAVAMLAILSQVGWADAEGVSWPEPGQVVRSLGRADSPPARHPDPRSPLIALTFDDGPHATRTPAVLDVLKRERVRATFFVTGENAKRYPDLIRRMAAEGHVVASHTMRHANLARLSRSGQQAEINQGADVVDSILGPGAARCLRPPYGAYDATTVDVARQRGLAVVMWSRDSGDWRGHSTSQIVANSMSTSGDGGRGILGMHDTKNNMVAALPRVIEGYRDRGYGFTTICGDGRAPEISEDDRRYVQAAYRTFLGRDATQAEVSERGSRLYYGYGTADLTDSLSRTPEWVGRAVDTIYREVLGRRSDPEGLAYWTDLVRRGVPITDVGVQILSSEEYYRRSGGSPGGFVDAVYQGVLRRTADPQGRAYWIDQLQRGTSRMAVAWSFYDSLESRQTRVENTFGQMFARRPDPGGLAYWSGQLQVHDDIVLASRLAQSDEFHRRSRQIGA